MSNSEDDKSIMMDRMDISTVNNSNHNNGITTTTDTKDNDERISSIATVGNGISMLPGSPGLPKRRFKRNDSLLHLKGS
jgi:hypothetical protein